ncbi:hypothetical protein ACQEU5_07810 [Marinactinospora thermotolerans]|uniref:hypothetical protein n=1 Tax=Marinactinospora thermotolerans TaxID=531310 RepID=UPI0013566A70|nr:hypothetical protein [Marinactinospora thermotolerans]
MSKSQVVRLGERLISSASPSEDDLTDLSRLLLAYDEALESALGTVRGLGFTPSSRVKNTGTVLEKLRRHGGSWLKSMQDLAGMRIVLDGGRREQDRVTETLMGVFQEESRAPRLVDRRKDPSSGYRAVHVIVYPGGLPVEIQVRTRWQHEWADMFEKLSDLVGRGIRYGEPPEHRRHRLADHAESLTPEQETGLDLRYDTAYRRRASMVDLAIAVSDVISTLEQAEAAGVGEGDPGVQEGWRRVHDYLAKLREDMNEMALARDV